MGIAITVLLYSLATALGIAMGIQIGARIVYRKEVWPRDIDPDKYYEVRYSSNYSHYIVRKQPKE